MKSKDELDKVMFSYTADSDQIEEPPKIGSRWRTEFIKGIGKRDDEFIIILDIERLFSTDEIVMVHSAGSKDEDSIQAVA